MLDDLFMGINFLKMMWWFWLLIIALLLWRFVSSVLGFSPFLSILIWAILVYILLIKHPIISSSVVILYFLLMMGLLWILPSFFPFRPRRD